MGKFKIRFFFLLIIAIIYKRINCKKLDHQGGGRLPPPPNNPLFNNQIHNSPVLRSIEVAMLISVMILIMCVFVVIHSMETSDEFGKYSNFFILELAAEYFYGIIMPVAWYPRNKQMRNFLWRELKDFVGIQEDNLGSSCLNRNAEYV